jgi:hypothetical protein
MMNILKKIFSKCNNFKKNPYIQYRRESDVSDMFSYSVLCTKTIDELEAMLADENLLPNDDITNIDIIDRITEVIIEKENIPEYQSEKEEMEFWDKFLVKHKTIPLRLEDVKKIRKKAKKTNNVLPIPESTNCFEGSYKRRKWQRSIVAVTTVVAVVLVGNAITTFAYGTNLLQVIVSFTDDVLRKDYVSQETSLITSVTETPAIISKYATLQEAFDAFGIASQVAPMWLPQGFTLSTLETSTLDDRYKISALYKSDSKTIMFSITSYRSQPNNQSRIIEKDMDEVEVFTCNNIEHYIFTNANKTVSTWINGMTDFVIQGDITKDEMKCIIKSMNTTEDE